MVPNTSIQRTRKIITPNIAQLILPQIKTSLVPDQNTTEEKMQNYQKTTQNIGNNQGWRAYIPLPVP